jgi:hypothetical protein
VSDLLSGNEQRSSPATQIMFQQRPKTLTNFGPNNHFEGIGSPKEDIKSYRSCQDQQMHPNPTTIPTENKQEINKNVIENSKSKPLQSLCPG